MCLLLLGGSVLGEHANRPKISGLHDVRTARTHGCNRLDCENRIEQRAALPAVLLGDGDTQKPLLRHQLRHIPRVTARMRALERAGGEVLLGEAPYGIAKLLLFGGQPEVHVIPPIQRDACRAAPAAAPIDPASSKAGSPASNR